MFWGKGKKEKKEPRLKHFVTFEVKYEPVTPEQIRAFQEKQRLLRYMSDPVSYSNGYRSIVDDDPFHEPDPFHESLDDFDKPFRKLEARIEYMGVPRLGDIKVEGGKTYMVTGVTAKYGVRQVYDP